MVLPFPILLTSYLYLKNVVILHQKRHLCLNSAIPDTKLHKSILNVMLKIVMSTSVSLSNTRLKFMLKIISVFTLQKTTIMILPLEATLSFIGYYDKGFDT